MTPPLVSVVTPVYNGEPYLRVCIESVLSQTYPHWDYTIVNNGSTDGTLAVAREYAARDPRIRIHDNERHVRVIENHNIAFRQISPSSTYCKVVAADDWLFPPCLERMVAVAEANPRVAIVGAYGLFGAKVLWSGLPYPSTVVPGGREACRMRLLRGDPSSYVFGTPTSVLFRSTIVRSRHAFYNESNLHADSEACFEFLGDHDFGFVHEVLTFSRDQAETLTSHSKRCNTYLPGMLHELVTYGSKFLTDVEWQRRIKEHLRDYYDFLGEQAWKRRGREFWHFHREKLARAGHPLSVRRLALWAGWHALDRVLNPKKAAGEAWRRFRTRHSHSRH